MMLVLLWATVAASSIGAWRYIAGAVDRAAPFSGGYTTLALFDASAIPIAVAFIADSRAGHRWFNVAALVTMLAGLVMTETRAGWLAALAGVVVIGLAISKRVTAGVVLAALAIALAVPQSRLSIFNRSEIEKKGGISSGRLELWSAAREPLTHLPFFGYGPGSFLRLIPKEALEATGDPGIQSWHATALDILIESGPMALLLIMGLAIVTLWESWRSYFRAVNGRLRSLALFSTLVALYLASLTTNLARDFMLSSLLVIVWSLSFADDSQAEAAGNKSLSSVSLA
jgi:O-antigen ligase